MLCGNEGTNKKKGERRIWIGEMRKKYRSMRCERDMAIMFHAILTSALA
jgi:hypothetical protein